MEAREIEKLRNRGMTVPTAGGDEGVRITAQCRRLFGDQSRQERRLALEAWGQDLELRIATHGGQIVPGSLSVTGQTIDVIVPIESLPSLEADLSSSDIRVDFPVNMQIVQGP